MSSITTSEVNSVCICEQSHEIDLNNPRDNKISSVAVSSINRQSIVNEEDIACILLKYRGEGAPIANAACANDLNAVKKLLSYGADPKEALRGAIKGKSLTLVTFLVETIHVPLKNFSLENDKYYAGVLYNSAIIGWWDGFDYFMKHGAEAKEDLFEMVLYKVISTKPPIGRQYSEEFWKGEILNQLTSRGIKARNLSRLQNYREWSDRRGRFSCVLNNLFDPAFTARKTRIQIVNALGEAQFPLDQYFYFLVSEVHRIRSKLRYGDWVKEGFRTTDGIRGEGGRYWETTPLQCAIALNDVELVEAILQAKADPNYIGLPRGYVGGNYGEHESGSIKDPLENAMASGNQDIIALLVKYGAKI